MEARRETLRPVPFLALALLAAFTAPACAKGDDGPATLFDDGDLDAGVVDASLADGGGDGRRDSGLIPGRDSAVPVDSAAPVDAGVDTGFDAGFVCNAASCPSGCCAGNACVTGTANDACGTGGAACATCPSPAQACTAQACAAAPCGPATCAQGCCSNNTCMGGALDAACGAGGAACTNCTSSNKACKAGACVAAACGPTTCAQGCCDRSGTCQPGTDDLACGKGGKTCSDCSQTGFFGICQSNQTCL